MNEQFDLITIFFGDATLVILLEITFRTTVLFLFTLGVMRMVGHRGLGQLSMAEFVLILALGSAVGDPMFYAEIPLIYGMLVIGLIGFYQVILGKITLRSKTLDRIVDGQALRLVADGMFDLNGMEHARLSRFEVMAELRQSGIPNLGEIKRAYLELDGHISVFPCPPGEGCAGLSLLPDYIEKPPKWSQRDRLPCNATYACTNCGYAQEFQSGIEVCECSRCQAQEWMEAVQPASVMVKNKI